MVHEKCPDCDKRSTNTHDPSGPPKLLKCSCGNRWHTTRYIPEPKQRRKGVP